MKLHYIMSTLQKIAKNTASLLFSRIICGLLAFISMVYLARTFCPDDFGKINFAAAIITYFALLANLGLPLLGTRETAKDKDSLEKYVSGIVTLRFLLSLIVLCLLFITVFYLNKPLQIKYLLIVYGLGIMPSALLVDWAFQGLEKMEYIGIGNTLGSFLYVVLVFFFIKSGQQLIMVPFILLASNIFTSAFLYIMYVKKFGKIKLALNVKLWAELLKKSLPIGISLIMLQIFYNIDTVFLGFMRSNAEVGCYNAAYKIIMLLIMATGAYHDAIFPLISNYYNTSLEKLQKLIFLTEKLMTIIALPLAITITFFAKPIINLIYGSKYDGGIIALQILVWAVLMIYINTAYGRGLLACGKQSIYLKIMSILAVINITLNILLIPKFGIVGAAVATAFTEFAAFYFQYTEFNKISYIPLRSFIFKPLLASFFLGTFFFWAFNFLKLNMYIVALVGFFLYFAVLYLTKCVTSDELIMIRAIFLSQKNREREQ